jgi:hypothetical protein
MLLLSTTVVLRRGNTTNRIQPTGIPQTDYHALQLEEMEYKLEKLTNFVA